MKAAKLAVTIALLLFVAATLGTLIAQEIAGPGTPRIAAGGDPSMMTGEAAGLEDPGFAVTEEPERSEVETQDEEEAPDEMPCAVDAIYFHNTHRCWTCQKIEQDARVIVEVEFAEELAAGKLRWSSINMEEERAYISQYDLVMPTLVLVRRVGDEAPEWIALDDTWGLIRSEPKFSMYVVSGLRAFLEGCR